MEPIDAVHSPGHRRVGRISTSLHQPEKFTKKERKNERKKENIVENPFSRGDKTKKKYIYLDVFFFVLEKIRCQLMMLLMARMAGCHPRRGSHGWINWLKED